AKMMGFADVNLVAHQTETMLIAAAEVMFIVDRDFVDQVFEGFDLLRQLLTKRTGSNDDSIDLAGFVDRVQDVMRAHERGLTHSDALVQTPEDTALTPPPGLPEEPTFESGASETELDTGLVVRPHPLTMSALEESDGMLEEGAPPSTVPMSKRPSSLRRSTRTRVSGSQDTVEDESARRRASPLSSTGMLRIQTENSLRVRFDKLERLGDVASEALLLSRRFGYHLGELSKMRVAMRDMMQRVEPTLLKNQFAELREWSHQLDTLSNRMLDDAHLVGVRSGQLDDEVRSLRHVPLAQALSHYPRAVRDLAKDQGKRVRFVYEVGDVEVDRQVLSTLSDPLLHLIRNAVDHGVESPEDRTAQGKEEEAEIALIAEHVGDSLRVTLRDDGAGIDPNFIRERALAKNVITEAEVESLDDQQALVLIFEPGFSTRTAVSDISGRGIGMDVVLRQVTSVGGVVEVESEPHRGTTFTLLMPLSSAVISVLLVSVGGRTFGIHAKDVDRVDTLTSDEIVRISGVPCVRDEGELLALLDWRGRLGITQNVGLPEDTLRVLIVRKGARKMAVWIDRVIGERQAINRPIGAFLQGLRTCRGVALTEAGEVVPLLNVVELLSSAKMDLELSMALGGSAARPNQRQTWSTLEIQSVAEIKTILVAEDSEITRTLVTGILRGLGYRVLEAGDGREAWQLL
ncbi:MAG: ATP-binding protein, partial [Myxococcota bacterium]